MTPSSIRRIGFALLLTTITCCSNLLWANEVETHLTAVISDNLETISGTVTFVLTPNRGDAPATFLLYPNFFKGEPNRLADHIAQWIYPKGESDSAITITNVAVNGTPVPKTQWHFFAPRPLLNDHCALTVRYKKSSSIPRTVSVTFVTKLPRRRGQFGHFARHLMAGGGWFPMLAVDAKATLPAATLNIFAKITAPKGVTVLVDNDLFSAAQKSTEMTVHRAHRKTLPIVASRHITLTTTTCDATTIRLLTTRYHPKKPQKGSLHLPSRLHHLACAVLHSWHQWSKAPIEPVTLVELPLWDHLATSSNTVTFFSDRLWKLVPLERARLFHDKAIMNAIATQIAFGQMSITEKGHFVEPSANMVARIITSQTLARRQRHMEQLSTLLGPAAFIPYVDNLLYAAQMPFQESFSQKPEPDGAPDEPWRFNTGWSNGGRLLAKLEDLLGTEVARKAIALAVKTNHSVVDQINKALGDFAPTFFHQWMGRLPKRDIRLDRVTTQKTGPHQFMTTAHISTRGARVVEPVTVRFIPKKGAPIDRIWNCPDGVAVTITTRTRIKTVILDPEHRINESATVAGVHPGGDNRWPVKWRPPLLTRFLIWGDSVTRRPFASMAFSLRPLFNTRKAIHIFANYTPRQIGAALAYYRYMGRLTTMNSRTTYTGPLIELTHFRKTSAISNRLPASATLAGLRWVLGQSDTAWPMDPRNSTGWSSTIGFMHGQTKNGDPANLGSFSFRATFIRSLTLGHTLASITGTGGIVGTPPFGALATLSDRQRLRGFDINETYGKLVAYQVLEYRHTLLGRTGVDFPLATHLDRVQGVLFAAGGVRSDVDSYRQIGAQNHRYLEVGYGLRFHLLMLGVAPYLLAIDGAVPIMPRTPTRLTTEVTTRRSPFRLVFSINQTY